MNKVLVPGLMILVAGGHSRWWGAAESGNDARDRQGREYRAGRDSVLGDPTAGMCQITIVGARNVPLIARLREAKDRRVLISVTRDESPVSSGEVEGSSSPQNIIPSR